MKTKVIAIAVSIFFSIGYGQIREFGKKNGYDWAHLREIAEGNFSQVDWTNKDEWVKGFEETIKIFYVTGVFELSANLPSESWGRYLDNKGKEQYYSVGHPFPYTYGLTVGQMVDGLNKFYSDYRNMSVRILDAMHVVQMGVTGKSEEEIEWQTRYYRADDQTRSKMLDEKYRR